MLDQLERSQTAEQQVAPLSDIAADLGLDEAQVDAVVRDVLPRLSSKFEQRTLSRGGLADMLELVGHARGLLGDASGSAQAAPGDLQSEPLGSLKGVKLDRQTADTFGITVLDQLIGSKDRSRFLAAGAARRTGVDAEKIKRLLPGLGVAAITDVAARTAPEIDGLVTKFNIGGGKTLPPQAPLPLPGDIGHRRTGGSYDDLSDVIRMPKADRTGSGRGSIDSTLRDMLGRGMGYQNRGVMGWLLRAAVIYFVWPFVRRFLGRILGGR